MQDNHDEVNGIYDDSYNQEESKVAMDPTGTIVSQPNTSRSQSQISETGEQIMSGNYSKNVEEV